MTNQDSGQNNQQLLPNERKGLSAEQWVLLAGLICLVVFLWIIGFLFVPLLAGSAGKDRLPLIVQIVATQGFMLPPTWTPGPTRQIIHTPLPTDVYNGLAPTRIYTPRPTSLPGVPMPVLPARLSVIDLARIMQGESPGDLEAAYYVGWVAKNRLLHPGYGDTYAVVRYGFFGYRPDLQPSPEFLKLASRIIRDKHDPTSGCLYALSRTDITNLGIPPQRADVTKGEWFFFRTWPLTAR